MKQTTKRVVAFFAAMGLMVSGLSLNEPASADALPEFTSGYKNPFSSGHIEIAHTGHIVTHALQPQQVSFFVHRSGSLFSSIYYLHLLSRFQNSFGIISFIFLFKLLLTTDKNGSL